LRDHSGANRPRTIFRRQKFSPSKQTVIEIFLRQENICTIVIPRLSGDFPLKTSARAIFFGKNRPR
jgi:hypothetical protein